MLPAIDENTQPTYKHISFHVHYQKLTMKWSRCFFYGKHGPIMGYIEELWEISDMDFFGVWVLEKMNIDEYSRNIGGLEGAVTLIRF